MLATAAVIDPDVSNAIMKYGFDGAGHCDGSGDKHAGGSAARAPAGAARAAAMMALPRSVGRAPRRP
ncbi:MAG: hypothetical protein L6Q76_19830, partial [Polyangiaceae bacterium]|nr:hypothetical protein [Polyangiaceae bacterium]